MKLFLNILCVLSVLLFAVTACGDGENHQESNDSSEAEVVTNNSNDSNSDEVANGSF
ncbi:MAG: hypothetical protein P8P74_13495 [Crocinitomicaceae bacterium]|nr:hypothetical protein [Crocinitomicaceae bacterium]